MLFKVLYIATHQKRLVSKSVLVCSSTDFLPMWIRGEVTDVLEAQVIIGP